MAVRDIKTELFEKLAVPGTVARMALNMGEAAFASAVKRKEIPTTGVGPTAVPTIFLRQRLGLEPEGQQRAA